MAKYIYGTIVWWDDVKLEPFPSPPPVLDYLPEACRLAGKTIANQPELWCQAAWHSQTNGVRQSCALGQLEDVLSAQFGSTAAIGSTWVVKINKASMAVDPNGRAIASVNDDAEATPDTVADHLYAVADELEFGGA